MPALGEARRRAKALICLTRLRSLGQLAQIYTNQNDYQFWRGGGWDTMNPTYDVNTLWWRVLGSLSNPGKNIDGTRNYVSNWRMRCCAMAEIPVGNNIQHPTDPFKGWGPFPTNFNNLKSWEEKGIYGSYGANSWVNKIPPGAKFKGVIGTGAYTNDKFWQVTLVKNGDQIPVFMDCSWHEAFPDTNNIPPIGEKDVWYSNVHGYSYPEDMKLVCVNRHSQCTHIVFMDGSARKVALKQLWYLKWNRKSYTDGRAAPTYNTPMTGLWMARFKERTE